MKWIVPYTNFGAQYLKQRTNFLNQFNRVMLNGDFILRGDVLKFEKNIAKYLGVKHVIGVNSGTDALLLSLGCLGIKKDSEIISVAHTAIATLSAIVHTGCKPKLVDIAEDFNMNVEEVEKRITRKTKAIVPVHLNGRSCEMDKVLYLAKKYKLLIVEDAAQALGARFKGKMAGTFGIAGAFSLHPLKSLNCAGDGGFVATNNRLVADKLRRLRNHGQKKRNEIIHFGFCSRLDNLQAALVNVKFKTFKEQINKRRFIAKTYSKLLRGLPIILPEFDDGRFFDTYNSYVIRTKKQKRLFRYLLKNKIEVFIHWPKPWYHFKSLKLDKTYLSTTERFCKEVISLPIYPELRIDKVYYTAKMIKFFFDNQYAR